MKNLNSAYKNIYCKVPLIIAAFVILIDCVLLSGCTGANKSLAGESTGVSNVESSQSGSQSDTVSSDDGVSDNSHIKVVASVFPGYDFARNVGMDRADVYLLLKPGMESHTFEPTPKDIMMIKDCDMFIYAGGESDQWLEEILSSVGGDNKTILSMLDCVNSLEEEMKEGMREGGVLGDIVSEDDETEYDEHVWTSPANAISITNAISECMCSISPADADYFKANAEQYVAKLCKLDKDFKAMSDAAAIHEIIVADRFPFRYMCEEYGIDYFAAFPGCSEDAEVTAKSLIFLSDRVVNEHIPNVFYIEFSNEKIADTICEVTGCGKKMLHSCHNLSKEEMESGADYISLMYDNLNALSEAMN